MHRHLTLTEYGQFIGVRGECLLVRDKNRGNEREFPLNRLKTVQLAKKGVTVSSDALLKCAARGIKLFICDYRNQTVACLSGTSQHAVVEVRRKQFECLESAHARQIAARVVAAKIRNQRATLLYFGKYHTSYRDRIGKAASSLEAAAKRITRTDWDGRHHWREELLGLEGQAASTYWHCLRESFLLPEDFPGRQGRHCFDTANMALNYGYAILTTYIWNAVINAGLEPYAGFYHTKRPGKPSLILDLMEEYRPWVVDRTIVKRRSSLGSGSTLNIKLRRKIVADIHSIFCRKYHYRGRRMRLESILQRQVYHLAGAFAGTGKYRPYTFRW